MLSMSKDIGRRVIQSRVDTIIGKRGVSDEVLREIDSRLEVKGFVKVRVLKSALLVSGMDRRSIARYVAEKLGAKLVDVRGRTFVLYKPKRSDTRRGG